MTVTGANCIDFFSPFLCMSCDSALTEMQTVEEFRSHYKVCYRMVKERKRSEARKNPDKVRYRVKFSIRIFFLK